MHTWPRLKKSHYWWYWNLRTAGSLFRSYRMHAAILHSYLSIYRLMAVTRGLMQFSGKRSHKVEASMLYGYSRLSSQSFNANEICSFWREKRILIYSEILYLQILFIILNIYRIVFLRKLKLCNFSSIIMLTKHSLI